MPMQKAVLLHVMIRVLLFLFLLQLGVIYYKVLKCSFAGTSNRNSLYAL